MYTLEGWAAVDEEGKQCTLDLVGTVVLGCSKGVFFTSAPCLVSASRLQKQRIFQRRLYREFRIPGAMVSPPVFSSALAGVLDTTQVGSDEGGGDSAGLMGRRLVQEEKDKVVVAKISIGADAIPVEFLQWVKAHAGFLPLPVGNFEAVYWADGRTSPAGDIMTTNKMYYVANIDMAFPKCVEIDNDGNDDDNNNG
jgi:hypothetical protein